MDYELALDQEQQDRKALGFDLWVQSTDDPNPPERDRFTDNDDHAVLEDEWEF